MLQMLFFRYPESQKGCWVYAEAQFQLLVSVAVGESMSRSLEIRVVASLLGGDATGRVVLQTSLQQGQAVLVEVRTQGLRIVAVPLGECRFEVGVRGDTGPNLLRWGSQETESLEDLVDFRVTREERLSCAHFGEDGAYGPHIHTSRVLTATQKNFGGTVPQGDDFVRIGP